MSMKVLNRLLLITFIFILSCQNSISGFKKQNVNNDIISEEKFEKVDKIDLETSQNSVLQNINFNKDNKKIINNYEKKYKDLYSLKVFYVNDFYYALNNKSELLKIENQSMKIIERFKLESPNNSNKILIPVSFEYHDNTFIIGFKSGMIIRTNMFYEPLWVIENNKLLNTPLYIVDDMLVSVFNDSIQILNIKEGNKLFELSSRGEKIIQSKGGKIVNYFNLLHVLLPNSTFKIIDTLLLTEHKSKFNYSLFQNSLNNLNDDINIYKNYFSYIDNGKYLYTYDINNDLFIVNRKKINNNDSYVFYNNSLIVKNKNLIYFYNIKNGNLFNNIDLTEFIKDKESKLINVKFLNDTLNLFFANGKVLILENYKILKSIDLNIKKIKHIYTNNENILFSTQNGKTVIY